MYPDPQIHRQLAAERAELLRASYGPKLGRPALRAQLPARLRLPSSAAARLRSSRA
jgi:hypothetical protein